MPSILKATLFLEIRADSTFKVWTLPLKEEASTTRAVELEKDIKSPLALNEAVFNTKLSPTDAVDAVGSTTTIDRIPVEVFANEQPRGFKTTKEEGDRSFLQSNRRLKKTCVSPRCNN
jgi:hypothetical protein